MLSSWNFERLLRFHTPIVSVGISSPLQVDLDDLSTLIPLQTISEIMKEVALRVTNLIPVYTQVGLHLCSENDSGLRRIFRGLVQLGRKLFPLSAEAYCKFIIRRVLAIVTFLFSILNQ